MDTPIHPETPEGQELDTLQVLAERRERRNLRLREAFLNGDKALMAEIAHKSDVAARNRKLRSCGYEAVDVNNEVVADIMDRITQGETFQMIVDSLVESRIPAFPDTSVVEARSLAIGKLCAAAAMRLFRTNEKERPVGDATTVTGEEVQTEQRDLSEQEATRGNDRQMTAVLARIARHRGVHRADVYGVADWSRGIMRDNLTRMVAEADNRVMAALFDSNWTPETEVQKEAWIAAFQGDSVADVLFGAIPNISAVENLRASLLLRAFGMNPTSLTHLPEAVNPDMDANKVRNTYPPHYPYKPLKLTTQRSTRPDQITSDHRSKCIHCRHHATNNPFVVAARKVHDLAEAGKKRQDAAYVTKPYTLPKLGKNCPWGVVRHWRGLDRSKILPDSASNATLEALRRALVNFGQMVKKGRNQHWTDEASDMVLHATVRAFLEDHDGIGQGVRPAQSATRLPEWTNRRYRSIHPDEDDSAKEGRRFSIPTYGTNGAPMNNLSEADLVDSFTITLATGVSGLPGYESTPYLPGAERTNGLLLDMRDGWIKVSNTGNGDHEGVTGTFVAGLPELLEWTRAKNNARKVVKYLIANRHLITT